MTRSGLLVGACAALAIASPWRTARAASSSLVKGPYLTALGPSSVEVRVEVDPPGAASIEVKRADEPARSAADPAVAAMHTLRVDGLAPQTRYEYVVRAGGRESSRATFVTAPKDDAGTPFTFLVYGDDRSDDVTHAAIVRALLATPSDLLVNTGDVVEAGGSAAQWQTFFDIEAPLLRERPLFMSIGNHELYDDSAGGNFARYFGFATDGDASAPQRLYGTVRYGNTRFFFVNAFHDWRSGEERDWLERSLSHADAEPGLVWRVAVVHHGPWSAGPHGPNGKLVSAGIVGLLAAHHVDLVVSGHDHIYERGDVAASPSWRIEYLVSGGGGAPLYRVVQPLASTRKAEATYHFVEARVTSEAIRIAAKRVDGSLIERCGFTKGASWDCDAPPPAPSVAPAVPSSANPPVTRASATPSCSCGTPGGAGSPRAAFAAFALACLIYFARRRYSCR